MDLDLWIYGSGSDLCGKGRVKGNKKCLWTKANSNMDANLVGLLGSATWIYGSGSMHLDLIYVGRGKVTEETKIAYGQKPTATWT
jgi:hypothetical protein